MTPLIYAISNKHLGKIEQMALATLDGLSGEFVPYVFAPKGEVINEAQKLGFNAHTYTGLSNFTTKFWELISENPELNLITSDSTLSYCALFLNFFYRRRMTHLHLVTEDAHDKLNLNRSSRLNKYEVTLVALSKSVRERLIANGTRHERVRVIENFLPAKARKSFSRRREFQTDGVKKVSVVLRNETGKKIDFLLDAIDRNAVLRSLVFKIYGNACRSESLDRRIAEKHRNVFFEKLDENTLHKLSEADLYLHLYPEEVADQTVLAALAANVPVLVPDTGSEAIISHKFNGFSYKADDSALLAERLAELATINFDFLNAVARGGRHLLDIRFSPENGIEKYRRLMNENKDLDVDFARGKLIL